MNKNKIIQLALKSPLAPSKKVDIIAISQLLEKRTDSTMFKIYFSDISGLDFKDSEYTIQKGEYPNHIKNEEMIKFEKNLLRERKINKEDAIYSNGLYSYGA